MNSTSSLSRRALLFQTVAGVAVGALVPLGKAYAVAPAGDASYQPAYFTAEEWAVVHAFVDRLIPHDDEGPGAIELQVPRFVDMQMHTPYGFGHDRFNGAPFVKASADFGNQLPYSPREIYRQGIAALNGYTVKAKGHKFQDLSPDVQEAIIHDMEKGNIALSPVPAKLLFSQFMHNAREGYFSDPIHGGNVGMGAWKMIGFPGARADFTDWVNQNGAKYPFGPVSIVSGGMR